MKKSEYKQTLHAIQIELSRLHRHIIGEGLKVMAVFEGRDAAGKDGTIKRIVRHLSPREVRVVALGKPSDREQSSWYFQRFVPHLPAAGEFVLFNRSWYNRAGVERVFGFCTDEQYDRFINDVPMFEDMLVRSGIRVFKYYLDISKDEQSRRLEARRRNPLKHWKMGGLDEHAIARWGDYSACRDAMLTRTSHPSGPWTVVRADSKKKARINVIRHLLAEIDYAGKDWTLLDVDPAVVAPFTNERLADGSLAR